MEKNCPFCGESRAAVDVLNYTSGKPGRFRVQCQNCLSVTRWFDAPGEAWDAWNTRPPEREREPEQISFLFGANAFVLNSLMYYRNHETGNCTAQKEFRGRLVRIKEGVFASARKECERICGRARP